MFREFHASLSLVSSAHISNASTEKDQRDKISEMGVSSRQNDVLKLVHPGRRVEFYREPITASEIMTRYPRHCVARPDFFEFPWIVVRPESVLVPGTVFYLVPYRTIYKLLKAKMQQESQSHEHHHSSKQNQSSKPHHHHDLNRCTKQKSLAGVSPKHQQQDKYKKRQSCNNANNQECYACTEDQDSETAKSLYKSSFYKSWNKMRRNLHQPQEDYNLLTSGLDSPFDNDNSFFSLTRSGQSQITSPEPGHDELLEVKSCLRKKDSIRKKHKLKVSFASPVVIPGGSRGESPWSVEQLDAL